MANVQTVGIGLYLALGVIQALSSTGVAGLNRRVATLRNGVMDTEMTNEIRIVRRLSGAVSGLEIGFHDLNRRLLIAVFLLFAVSLALFGWCTAWQGSDARHWGEWLIFFYYLALPILIFIMLSLIIGSRCRQVAKRVDEAETNIQASLLRL